MDGMGIVELELAGRRTWDGSAQGMKKDSWIIWGNMPCVPKGGNLMKPEVDEDLCIGDGICVDICPEVFEMRDDNLAHVINENPAQELHERVREAADACPTSAISIEE